MVVMWVVVAEVVGTWWRRWYKFPMLVVKKKITLHGNLNMLGLLSVLRDSKIFIPAIYFSN